MDFIGWRGGEHRLEAAEPTTIEKDSVPQNDSVPVREERDNNFFFKKKIKNNFYLNLYIFLKGFI